MKSIFKNCIVLFTLFNFLGCDSYLGYKLNADQPNDAVSVSGTIINVFTLEAVDSALVQMGALQTTTDDFGRYNLLYPLTTDVQRDKPIPFVVSRKNYAEYKTQFILYDQALVHNAALVYIAPIIIDATLKISTYESLYKCTAQIQDFQGTADIDTVFGRFYYHAEHEQEMLIRYFPFEFVRDSSSTIAFYECYVPLLFEPLSAWHIPGKDKFYYVFAVDSDGNMDYGEFD